MEKQLLLMQLLLLFILDYFNYYKEKDVNTAKEYLDKWVANADKDCETDYFVGDYLFRAGKYQESLQQAKNMEAGNCKNYPSFKCFICI